MRTRLRVSWERYITRVITSVLSSRSLWLPCSKRLHKSLVYLLYTQKRVSLCILESNEQRIGGNLREKFCRLPLFLSTFLVFDAFIVTLDVSRDFIKDLQSAGTQNPQLNFIAFLHNTTGIRHVRFTSAKCELAYGKMHRQVCWLIQQVSANR